MKLKKTKIDNNDAFRYETQKKKNLFHLSQTVVLPLLATTSGAADRE